ncbi:MAG: trehalase family glycosidase [bacterium]
MKDESVKKYVTPLLVAAVVVLSGISVYVAVVSPENAPHPSSRSSVNRISKPVVVPVEETWNSLLREEDTDGDKKITVEDKREGQGKRGDREFMFGDRQGNQYKITGTYQLSILLQELSMAREEGKEFAGITPDVIYENPVHRTSRLIREVYWDELTRGVDEEYLPRMFEDPKVESEDPYNYVYVPHSDTFSLEYFEGLADKHPDWKMKVARLPENITGDYVRSRDGRHGILSLKLVQEGDTVGGAPFVAPGGRFNEMYGWDCYFEALGLLVDGRTDLARAMVNNHVYEIEHYGKILNANRSYYLTRSQPPFLTSMALAVYEKTDKNKQDKEWLADVMKAAIKEHNRVWTSEPRLTDTGLSRYYGEGEGPCVEVESGHYDPVIKPRADAQGVSPAEYLAGYKSGKYKDPSLDRFFVHDRAVRESGNDTTYRFAGRCADFNPVDLNALLYKMEMDIARTIEEELGGSLKSEFGKETPEKWREKARERKRLMNKLMWDAEKGMYFDYDFRNEQRSDYIYASTLYPVWAGMVSPARARLIVNSALKYLEQPGGLAASAQSSRGSVSEGRPPRQWDYPYGWPPHQMLAWSAMDRYGLEDAAQRTCYKWLYTITKNARDYNGTIPEKFNVFTRSHQVFAEYGNVGTEFDYITREGFGWMNASYQMGLEMLSDVNREELIKLTTPALLFPEAPPSEEGRKKSK